MEIAGEDERNFYISYYGSNAFGVERNLSFQARVEYSSKTMKFRIIKIH